MYTYVRRYGNDVLEEGRKGDAALHKVKKMRVYIEILISSILYADTARRWRMDGIVIFIFFIVIFIAFCVQRWSAFWDCC